jgi:hypothetical protein
MGVGVKPGRMAKDLCRRENGAEFRRHVPQDRENPSKSRPVKQP